jgi:hypothetical protein
VVPVYREVARVLRVGGIYISQHKQPTSLQTGLKQSAGAFPVRYPYYSREPLPPEPIANLVREEDTLEYVHRWEDLLGAMCRSGLVIEDLTEPMHAQADAAVDSFEFRCQFVAPYVRVKARRVERSVEPHSGQIWMGDP